MIPIRRTPRRPFRTALAASLVLAVGASACASSGLAPLPARPSSSVLAPGSPLLSGSLGEGDAWLRHYLMTGDHDGALGVLRGSAARPGDRLLRTLQEGVVLHYAGRYSESNRLFEWAEQEADRRYTRSIRRGVGALVINDKVLAYTPSNGELAIIPYFRMLNYLALGRLDGAAVEARKSSAYLARLDRRNPDACAGFGLVQYLSGLVFASVGERNDALVSLRQADRSFQACGPQGAKPPAAFAADLYQLAHSLGVDEVAESVAERYDLSPAAFDPDAGDLVVLVEHGFAAHRMQQDVYVPILEDEIGGLKDGETALAAAAAGRITARLTALLLADDEARHLWEAKTWNPTLAYRADADPLGVSRARVAHVLRLAWPVMRLEASRAASARLVVNGVVTEAPALEDVSARLVRDLESRRTSILTRMVTRALIKYAVSREVEEKVEEKHGELLGALVGLVTNVAANALEQADTRSWSLLPDQIAMARVRLPAGEHHVQIQLVGAGGVVVDVVDLGMVSVRPGERVFLSRRVWGPEAGDRERLIRLGLAAYDTLAAPPRNPDPGAAAQRRPRPRRGGPPVSLPPVIGTPAFPVGTPPASGPDSPPPVGSPRPN